MNQDSLTHIVNQNEQLNADVVIDLVQLCQSFPYFSLPYVILSKHYAFKHDFRTENTLFQAALRVSDREWMYQYIHKTNSLLAETLTSQNTKISDSENIEVPFFAESATIEPEIITDIAATTNNEIETVLDETPIQIEDHQTTFEVAFEKLNNESEIESFNEENNNSEPEKNLEAEVKLEGELFKITETIYNHEEQEKTFPIEETLNILVESNFTDSPVADFNKEPESMLFIPSIEAELPIETTDLEVEKTNRTWLFNPETDESNDDEIIETGSKNEISVEPEIEKPNPIKGLNYAAGYNIEDYFKIEQLNSNETEKAKFEPEVQNNDFFAWLNSGLSNQGPIIKPKEVSKNTLIDKFIQENPSIQRPKQEFFSPEKAMKKSEVLDMNLATETLAKIYTMQGYPEKAIKVYKQLQLKFPEKLSYFASLINKIKQEHNL